MRDAGRGGGFALVNLRAMEVTLSGGFTGNYLGDDPSGYVALGLYRQEPAAAQKITHYEGRDQSGMRKMLRFIGMMRRLCLEQA